MHSIAGTHDTRRRAPQTARRGSNRRATRTVTALVAALAAATLASACGTGAEQGRPPAASATTDVPDGGTRSAGAPPSSGEHEAAGALILDVMRPALELAHALEVECLGADDSGPASADDAGARRDRRARTDAAVDVLRRAEGAAQDLFVDLPRWWRDVDEALRQLPAVRDALDAGGWQEAASPCARTIAVVLGVGDHLAGSAPTGSSAADLAAVVAYARGTAFDQKPEVSDLRDAGFARFAGERLRSVLDDVTRGMTPSELLGLESRQSVERLLLDAVDWSNSAIDALDHNQDDDRLIAAATRESRLLGLALVRSAARPDEPAPSTEELRRQAASWAGTIRASRLTSRSPALPSSLDRVLDVLGAPGRSVDQGLDAIAAVDRLLVRSTSDGAAFRRLAQATLLDDTAVATTKLASQLVGADLDVARLANRRAYPAYLRYERERTTSLSLLESVADPDWWRNLADARARGGFDDVLRPVLTTPGGTPAPVTTDRFTRATAAEVDALSAAADQLRT